VATKRLLTYLATFATGLAAGAVWIGASDSNEKIAVTPGNARVAEIPLGSSLKSPSLVVDRSGHVSAQLDNVPIAWLLDELSRQGVLTPGSPAGPVLTSSSAGPLDWQHNDEVPATAEPDPEVQDRLLETVLIGSEPERFASLTRALENGIDVPAEVLLETFNATLSDRLDLLAFSTYLDAASGDSTSAREALLRGVNSNSAAVRAEAGRRLVELERLESATVAQGDQ
jgi:hypothetical protein